MTENGLGLKPKVQPTPKLMSPLYDKLDHAIELLDCAYYATHHNLVAEEVADPIRAAMDDGVRALREIKAALHDMCCWMP